MPRPIIFAHRGACIRAPENTLAAFQLAESEGADAIELDARLSADGQVVVIHDSRLERTTNGSGWVSKKSLSELRSLEASGSRSQLIRGEKIPLLDEVLSAFGNKLLINIHLKKCGGLKETLVHRVCELVRKHAIQEGVIFSSFVATDLAVAKRLLPKIPRALLAAPGWLGAWSRSFEFSFGDYAALHPNVADVSPQEVRRVHKLNRRLHVWTINAIEGIRRLEEWGVDGIFTDDPLLASRALGRQV